MKAGQITIKDIARELNISPSTVSRALKGHPDISPDTKKAVNELATKLQYLPNSIAMSLRKSKTNTIGVVIPEIAHHFFSTVISGIEEIAYDAGYNVMICLSNESYEREVIVTKALISSRVDGLLVSISKETEKFDHLEALKYHNIPLVFFDRRCEAVDTSSVVVDDYEGAYKATEHLINQGFKKIAHLAGPQNLLISRNRLKGYTDAMNTYKKPEQDRQVIFGGLKLEDGVQAAATLLKSGDLPDGIFAASDPVAIACMQEFKKKNIAIPDRVAIVGFSDEPITSMLQPSLSTVSQPGFEIGKVATSIFLNQIELGEDFQTQSEILKSTLVIRESSSRKKS
jgi:LacI family transcriptional regulator